MSSSTNLPPIPDFPKVLPQEGDPWAFTAKTGLVDITSDELIPFTPVPRLRKRRDGWTEETQRLFILALSECGCVTKAARMVGMTARSAYRLLDAYGADSFAEAWDQAIARGIEKLRADAMDRAFLGAWVPVYRKGRLVRVEHRRNDKLAMALLSGRSACVADRRERAASRRRYRQKLLSDRAAEAEKKKRAEQVWAEHQAVLDSIEAENRSQPVRGTGENGSINPTPSSIRNPPRVRSL